MLELTVKNQLPIIESNFELVKTSLIESIAKFKGRIVTADTLKDAKADQIMLGKLEKKIDDYRKSVKKENEIPIKEFEANCKILIGLVNDTKLPLKEGIQVFDDAEKDKKKIIAEECIKIAITESQLNEKYASQLLVLPEYLNVAMTAKKIKTDIEAKAFLLLNTQTQEIEKMQIIADTIEQVNKGIDAKISIEDFQTQITMNMETRTILSNINERAERTKANELKAVADRKEKAEKEVLERIAKAEREAILKVENEKIQAELAEIAETERNNKIINDLEIRKTEEPKQIVSLDVDLQKGYSYEERPIEGEFKSTRQTAAPVEEKLWFQEMRLEGTKEKIMEVSKFLKDGGYTYTPLKSGRI